MTSEEFAEAMKKIYPETGDGYRDREEDHIAGDHLMCALLRSLGYVDGVEVFEKAVRWYS